MIGDAPATPALTAGPSVKVKLENGVVLDIPDTMETPWAKDPRLTGYNRFTFDPVNNLFVAGKGEAQFDGNWDDNGKRIKKVAPAPKKKVVKTEAAETTVTTEAPAVETPATETPAAETPAPTTPEASAPAETPTTMPAAQ